MKKGPFALAMIVALSFWGWFSIRKSSFPSNEDSSQSIQSASSSSPQGPNPQRVILKSAFVESYGQSGKTILQDLETVSALLTNSQSLLKDFDHYFLPDNQAITTFLRGGNREAIAWIPPDHPAVNQDGELTDRNGIALFFHRESAFKIQCRSAGNDQIMWSSDDVVYPQSP
jgi:hypothetical protein